MSRDKIRTTIGEVVFVVVVVVAVVVVVNVLLAETIF